VDYIIVSNILILNVWERNCCKPGVRRRGLFVRYVEQSFYIFEHFTVKEDKIFVLQLHWTCIFLSYF
jgi:hypothetical protein